ncbi:hypothetical protein SELMODRAFT_115746 [Selaginella moellendorffii]|uniref:Conserved oligomeric Golgi complex subunit 2 n=1 Tax=Selaginella moellendorffii TaxID=88036 RepID=D8SFL5_SELML|nr:conserved oligomeric Golgi complex subunit 2 [Selaginella moellendorffii]EFJ16858.1 hypothetical protein SELMODRAFT_115746 [Selaginella moellendorffii]|eukprot:XP_002982190.1 conserved oligomeric Golgi complex subunit 2 [Selaginella moellendorffii]
MASMLFGDDPDPLPLWFKKDAFMDPDFDCDAHISSLRSFVPLEALRGELRSHLAALKNELVELINRDYNDFVSLSTQLVDVDGAVLRMRTPLQELRGKLVTVRDGVDGALLALQDALKRRSEASASREILELLLDTSHVVSKIEKLLLELKENRISNGNLVSGSEGSLDPVDNSGDDPRSRLLERIASEMNRLKFYVARVQDLPFIKTIEKRIQNADASLRENLEKCIKTGLERRDEKVLYHCLRAYAAIDDTAGAEEAFRITIVAPFVSRIFPGNSSKDLVGGGAADKLEEDYKQVEAHIARDCKFMLDIVASENSGLNVFDFLGNSILKEVRSAIVAGKPGALSPGKPAEFLANYKSSLKFLSVVEGYCQSQAAVLALRSQASYAEFVKLWNLPAYFTLRFQEIASSFDQTLTEGLKRCQESDFAFKSSDKLLECLQRCWDENVFVSSLSDKFLKLSLQLISRYARWLSAGMASRSAADTSSWATSASSEDILLLRHDVELLHKKLTGSYLDYALGVLGPTSANLSQKSILSAAQNLLDVVPVLTDVLTDTLADKCVEELKNLKGITTTYRLTIKPLPTHHSHVATNLLQALRAFLQGDHNAYMSDACRLEILNSVAKKVTKNYDQQIRDLVEGLRKTESSLLRFRQARQRTGAGPDANDANISNTDKVCAQLLLDVQEHGRKLDELGVDSSKLPEFQSLWEFVSLQEKPHS